jgi:hypothetical protein
VEFALVLPILIVLLLGIADAGRIFAAGIALEAAARNAAEVAAQEYLQNRRESAAASAADFDRIHDAAMERICAEADVLPNKVVSGGSCAMPVAAVCIHDTADELTEYGGRCGQGAGAAPAECDGLHSAWPTTEPAVGDLPWVEVRVCYQFTTLFNLQDLEFPFGAGISFGNIWLERTRSFTVADY